MGKCCVCLPSIVNFSGPLLSYLRPSTIYIADQSNLILPPPALHTVRPPLSAAFSGLPLTMSAKRSSNEAEAPNTATLPQPAKKTKKDTDIELPDDVWSEIATFVDWRGFQALACACKMTRDAACDVDWLARDKVYVLRCWLALGGKEDTLRRRYRDKENYEYYLRDEPSDNLSEWLGVTVEGGRVTEVYWSSCGQYIGEEPLTGTIPVEIGALDGLTKLDLWVNQICGHLPPEIGRLTSLERLCLMDNRLEGPLPAELGALTALTWLSFRDNSFTGEIPSTFMNLTNLEYLSLHLNNFDTEVPDYNVGEREEIQKYLGWLKNPHEEFPIWCSDGSDGDYLGCRRQFSLCK